MLALGLTQFVLAPTHQAGHIPNLIFAGEISVDLEAINMVPDHFALKAQLSIPTSV